MLLPAQSLRHTSKVWRRPFTSDLWQRQCCALQLTTRCLHVGLCLHGPRWTKAEDECIVSMRRAGKVMAQIAEALPDRTLHGCCHRWGTCLIHIHPELKKYSQTPGLKTRKHWTETKRKPLLDSRAHGKSLAAIQKEDLPHRTYQAVQAKIETLAAQGTAVPRQRRRGTPFTAGEEETLRNMQTQDFTLPQIADILKRSAYTVRRKLEHMGLAWRNGRAGRTSKPWTDIELATLRQFLTTNTLQQRIAFDYEAIKYLVPGRSYDAIHEKLWLVRKQRELVSPKIQRAWTPAENEEVLRFMATHSPNSNQYTAEMFAATLSRSTLSVIKRMSHLRKRAAKSARMEGTNKPEG